ncbi:hypothetical protein Kisp01_69840 [Kineosporia sp. NBRC 101677]|nr:hypothetical protein Kisp01_69840 [Kineosporia sp. NBRC 101677]
MGSGLEDVGVDSDAVDDGSDQPWAGRPRTPLRKRRVGRDGHQDAVLGSGDGLPEQFRTTRIDLDATELILGQEVEAPVTGNDSRKDKLVSGSYEFVASAMRSHTGDKAYVVD